MNISNRGRVQPGPFTASQHQAYFCNIFGTDSVARLTVWIAAGVCVCSDEWQWWLVVCCTLSVGSSADVVARTRVTWVVPIWYPSECVACDDNGGGGGAWVGSQWVVTNWLGTLLIARTWAISAHTIWLSSIHHVHQLHPHKTNHIALAKSVSSIKKRDFQQCLYWHESAPLVKYSILHCVDTTVRHQI